MVALVEVGYEKKKTSASDTGMQKIIESLS